MESLSASKGPAFSLFAARFAYSLNWILAGAILPLIQRSFQATIAEMGVVVGALIAGAGLFALPAGVAAARWGPKATALGGLAVMGLGSVASGAAPSLLALDASRFITGAGSAFFFAPALNLLSVTYRGNPRGWAIGLFNGGTSLGGAIGVVGGVELGIALGWRPVFVLGGVLLLVVALVNLWALPSPIQAPRDAQRTGLGSPSRGSVFRSRALWILAIGLAGTFSVSVVVPQFLTSYVATNHPQWGLESASGVIALWYLASFPGSLVGGTWFRSRGSRISVLGVHGLVLGGLVALIPLLGFYPLLGTLLVGGGIIGSAYTLEYLLPTVAAEQWREQYSLAIGFLGTIQLLVSSGIVIIIGSTASSFGFTDAWLLAALLSVLPLGMFLVASSANGGSVPPRRRQARVLGSRLLN
ncbi:MAG: MFS transporter [Thermoplasmata archaeon]